MKIDVVKSAINFSRKYHFAMVYVLKDGLKLDFALSEEIDNTIILITRKDGNRYLHFIKVPAPTKLMRS